MKPPASLEENGVLASIGKEAQHHLETSGTIVELRSGELIRRIGEITEHVWLPLSGMVSLTIPLQDGSTVEAGLVGREGIVGLSSLLDDCPSADEAMIQLPGRALRIGRSAFRTLMERDASTMFAVLRCSHDLFAMVAQTAVCNVRHNILQRLARWILLAHDRSDGNAMALTQEFLGIMLGVQRNTVTIAAQTLQQQGAIQYTRGRLVVTSRPLLERNACECYRAVQARTSRNRTLEKARSTA